MSSMSDHLYEDGNTTGYRRKQTKSILKNRENMTMPNPSMPLRHFDTASRLANRRVSFANKVKLHKIDFVSTNGNAIPEEDSSDDEANVSLSELENNASSFVDLMRNVAESNSSDDDDLPQNENATRSTDDQTMDFTGLIRQPQEQDMEFTDQLDGKVNLAYRLSTENHFEHFDNGTSNMEMTMQLTKNVSSLAVVSNGQDFSFDSPKSHFLNGHKLQYDSNGNEEATMDFTKFFDEHSRQEIFQSIDAVRFSPMTMAGFDAAASNQDGEDMELTQPFTKPSASPLANSEEVQRQGGSSEDADKPPILTRPSLSEDEDEVNQREPDDEQTIELTAPVDIAAQTLPKLNLNEIPDLGITQKESKADDAESKDTESQFESAQVTAEERKPLYEEKLTEEATEKSTSVYGTPATSPAKKASHQKSGEELNIETVAEGPNDKPLAVSEKEPTSDGTTNVSSPRQIEAISEEHNPLEDIPEESSESEEKREDLLRLTEEPKPPVENDHVAEAEPVPEPEGGAEVGGEQEVQQEVDQATEEMTKKVGSPEVTSSTLETDGVHVKLLEETVHENAVETQLPVSQDGAALPHLELSQPMELTQSRSEIKSISETELPQKRPADDFEELNQKQPRSEAHVSTLDIPLAETSTLSVDGVDEDYDDPNYQPVSLPTFLNDIGVKFYDDLEIATDSADRFSLTLQEDTSEVSDEEYYKGNVYLPLLEVLELSCKELSQKIQQGKMLFQEVSEQTLKDNPTLFKQYYLSSYYDQISMKSHFHLLKEFTRHQAKQVWYQWRTQLMQNVLEVQQGNLEQLQSDKTILEESLEELEDVHANILSDLQLLKNDVSSFREIKASYKDLDASQLKIIKLQLMELNRKLLDHRDEITKKEAELAKVQLGINEVNADIQRKQGDLQKAESQISRRRHFSDQEIEELEHEVQKSESQSGLRYISGIGSNEIEFECNAHIGAIVAYQEATPTHIRFFEKTSDSSDLTFASLAPLAVECLQIENFEPVEALAKFKEAWQQVKQIDKDLCKLSLKYPFKLEVKKASLEFEVTVYSFETGTETVYALQLQASDILNYPKQLAVTAKHGRRLRTSTTETPKLPGLSKELTAKFQASTYD